MQQLIATSALELNQAASHFVASHESSSELLNNLDMLQRKTSSELVQLQQEHSELQVLLGTLVSVHRHNPQCQFVSSIHDLKLGTTVCLMVCCDRNRTTKGPRR